MLNEDGKTFWERIFDETQRSEREERVLEYVIYRLCDGARVLDIIREAYVRHNLSPEQAEGIIARPRLVEAARREMEQGYASGEPDPWRPAVGPFGEAELRPAWDDDVG
jgi:hypothetical protein